MSNMNVTGGGLSAQNHYIDSYLPDKNLPVIGGKLLNTISQPLEQLNSNYKLVSAKHMSQQQSQRSNSVIPTGSGRKAIKDGIDMIEAKFVQKDSSRKMEALENRIKRLVFEEQRANKLTDIANEKAEKLLKARDRHAKQIEDKLHRQQKKMEDVQNQLERNAIQKELHQEKLKQSRFQQQQRIMGMKRVMVTQEKNLFEKRIQEEENDYYRKRQQRDEIDQGKRQFLQMKMESKRMIENQQRVNYQMRVEDRNNRVSKINEKSEQLEEVERLLVEKLSMTQMNQHQALANLHKVVQICNSGIDLKQINSKKAIENIQSRAYIPVEQPGLPMTNLNVNSSILQIEQNDRPEISQYQQQTQQISEKVTPNANGLVFEGTQDQQDTSMMITAVPGDQ